MPMQNVVLRMMEMLDVSKAELAVMLGVSERSVRDWEVQPEDTLKASSTKGRRLWRLYEVVCYLREKDQVNPSLLKSVLTNGRIPMSSDPDEDMSLISYICAHPSAPAWPTSVDAAFGDHAAFIRSRESHRAANLSNASGLR